MTDQANTPLKTGEDIFKSLVWDNLVKAGLASLFATVTWLNIWPISVIVNFVVGKFADQLFNGARLLVDLGAIAFLNNEHKQAFTDADLQLRILAQEKGPDSPEYLKAKEDAKAKLSQFVRFGV